MKARIRFEELWRPWEVLPEDSTRLATWTLEVPDDLLAHLEAAKEEMQSVWDQLYALAHEQEQD